MLIGIYCGCGCKCLMEQFILLFKENMMCQDFFGDNLIVGVEVRFELWISLFELLVSANWGTRLIACQDSNRGFKYKNWIYTHLVCVCVLEHWFVI